MDMHEPARICRLRERPPAWPRRGSNDEPEPRRGSDDRPEPRRWWRQPESFEDGALPELYPGALVMEDLTATGDDVATLRVLARYTVARLFVLSVSGELTGSDLRTERRIALEHLGLLPEYDWERRALVRLAMRCREDHAIDVIEAATTAAEAAAKRSQPLGAFALYRAAYELAIGREWWAEAAQVARGIAQLARLEEASHSIRLWRRRSAVLDARALRAAEAADAPQAESESADEAGA